MGVPSGSHHKSSLAERQRITAGLFFSLTKSLTKQSCFIKSKLIYKK
jgi:hypothetical protein